MNNINTLSLNPTEIKVDLIEFFKNNPTWSSYNFEQDLSTTSLMMDILSAVTYKQNVYLNATLNETFLSTAKTRDAVVRKAKMMNYTPKSSNCANATVTLTFEPTNSPQQIIIPRGTRFEGSSNSGNLSFITLQTYICTPDIDFNYNINIDLYQGDLLNFTYIVSNSQKIFTVPNTGVDISKLVVNVKSNESDTNWVEYLPSNNIVNTSSNNVYFIQEGGDQHFEIYFGDGQTSNKVSDGNIISVDYIVTQGINGNSVTSFNLVDTLAYTPTISLVKSSENGFDIESIDSIKFYAPRFRNTQGRAVNAEDFEAIIHSSVPEIYSVSTWGGEENVPAYYGKVCISALTSSNYILSDFLKSKVNSLFNSNNIIGSKQLKWVDPEIINIIPSLQVYYNSNINITPTDLEYMLRYGIYTYNNQKLNAFNSSFNITEFVAYLKSLNSYINDIILKTTLQNQIVDYANTNSIYINYQNGLQTGSIISNSYYNEDNIICYLADDNKGNINEYTTTNDVPTILRANVGLVNYGLGTINIDNMVFSAILGDTVLRINSTNSTNKLISTQNVMLTLDSQQSKITLVA